MHLTAARILKIPVSAASLVTDRNGLRGLLVPAYRLPP